MAEKKTGKKFVQKPKFRNEKKYKTDKTEVKKYNTFGKKKAEKKIVVKSEKSLCPVHGKCGGCQLLDMPYEKQLKQKQKQERLIPDGFQPVHRSVRKRIRSYLAKITGIRRQSTNLIPRFWMGRCRRSVTWRRHNPWEPVFM